MDKLMDFQKRIAEHPILRKEIPIAFQLGFPQLEIKQGRLCVRYLLHKIEKQKDMLLLYPPQFELLLSYPFCRIVRFVNYTYERGIEGKNPLLALPWAGSGEKNKLAAQLLQECAASLEKWEKANAPEVAGEYQSKFWEITEKLGVFPLYRGE